MTGIDNKRKSEKGMTLLEALVSTAIIGIGFVAVFQMVNYSVQSIDVSGERTKASYLVSMVAEDIISEKHSDSPTTDKKFMDYLGRRNIGTQVHYIPIYHQPFYKKQYSFKIKKFRQCEEYYNRCLSIPIHPGLKKQEIKEIIDIINSAVNR